MRQRPALAPTCGTTATTIFAVKYLVCVFVSPIPVPRPPPGRGLRALEAAVPRPGSRRETPAVASGRHRPLGGPLHPIAATPATWGLAADTPGLFSRGTFFGRNTCSCAAVAPLPVTPERAFGFVPAASPEIFRTGS